MRRSIVIWNTEEAGRTLNVDLRSLPATLEGKEITVHTMDGGRPRSVFIQSVSSPVTSLRNLLIPKQGMVMLEIGKKQEQKTIKMARYARHYSMVPRTGTQAPPSGQGHYEIRKDSLVASTADNTGIAMASVVLAGVPENREYSIDADLSVSGLPESSAEGALVMRVDYLDRNQSLSAQYFVAEGHEGPSRLDGSPFGFLPATHYTEKRFDCRWRNDQPTHRAIDARRLGYRRRRAKKNPRFPASARNGTDYSRGQTIRQTKLALANSSETESSS